MSVNLKHEAQLKQEQTEKNNKKLNIATWTKKNKNQHNFATLVRHM